MEGFRRSFDRETGLNTRGARFFEGAAADRIARQAGGRAVTVGSDVYFRSGTLDPSSHVGRRLLAHELAHVALHGHQPVAWRDPPGPSNSAQDSSEIGELDLGPVREFQYSQIAQRTAFAVDSFRAAGDDRKAELREAARQNAEIGALFFTIAMSAAAPGLGSALTRLINSYGFRQTYSHVGRVSAERVNEIGEFYRRLATTAPFAVEAGMEVGKATFNEGLQRATRENTSEEFIAAAVQAYRESCQDILDNAPSLSDEALLATVAQFDSRVLTDAYMRSKLDQMLETFQRSVPDIAGPAEAGVNWSNLWRSLVGSYVGPVFLARGVHHQGTTWITVKGIRLDRPGEIHQIVPDELLPAALQAHRREWGQPPPIVQFLGGNRVGP